MIDWATARPTCYVLHPYPAGWSEKYFVPHPNGIPVREHGPWHALLLQLDAGVAITLTEPRYLVHHRVLRNGEQVSVDGAEVIYEPDAESLPVLWPGEEAA